MPLGFVNPDIALPVNDVDDVGTAVAAPVIPAAPPVVAGAAAVGAAVTAAAVAGAVGAGAAGAGLCAGADIGVGVGV